MTIDFLLDRASSVMTVVSFATFCAILWWAWSRQRSDAFAQAALLPFADEAMEEERHV
jgi:cytochrome c oxidase cbb3-type subunit 4